jgi:ADP-heptose:LPS heptosyltransferase
MNKQVLLINITRMGDLVQMGTLLQRLQHEWPGVAVDLVVDERFAPIAKLLPHLRHIIDYDFHRLVDESRAQTKDVVTLYREMTDWAAPLIEAGYDRVINLTFNRRSGLLASYVGAKEIRGIASPKDGDVVIHNPWMAYLTDVHSQRQFNHFNLVDIYALGGSGTGPFAPLSLDIPPGTAQWARDFFERHGGQQMPWMAVQVGASDPMKAWRPELFGQTLAVLSRQTRVGYVFIGTESERKAIQTAQMAYRQAGGSAPLCDAVGRTTLPQLAAVLAQCRLLLTNDTGPMHLAVGAGIPVIDLSVGHVDFRETGPYGPGHWIVQPDMGCAPCGFDQVCLHHACKDRLVPDQIASLCLHVLTGAAFPATLTGIKIFRSRVDEGRAGRCRYLRGTGRSDDRLVWPLLASVLVRTIYGPSQSGPHGSGASARLEGEYGAPGSGSPSRSRVGLKSEGNGAINRQTAVAGQCLTADATRGEQGASDHCGAQSPIPGDRIPGRSPGAGYPQ